MIETSQKDILISIDEYLLKLLNTMPNIVNAYRTADKDKIKIYTIPLIDGLQWINEALNLTKESHYISMSEIKDTLSELIDSIENNDSVLISDLLEFEVNNKLQNWKNKISDLLKTI